MTDPDGGRTVSARPTVLFLCVHNAGRSQMAAGWMRPREADRPEVRPIRDDIAERVRGLLRELGVEPNG